MLLLDSCLHTESIYTKKKAEMEKPLPFKIDTSQPLFAWRASTFWQKEPETIEWLKHFSVFSASENLHFLDVGANIGIYSLYWLSLQKLGRAISCEAFDVNSEILVKNLKLNGYLSRSEIVTKPIHSSSSFFSTSIADTRAGSSGFRVVKHSGVGEIGSLETITIDELLSVRLLDNFILKIDTDGTDFEILKGATESLRLGRIHSVLIEGSEEEQVKISEFLAKFNLHGDRRFNEFLPHSDLRRIDNKSKERNRVYTLSR